MELQNFMKGFDNSLCAIGIFLGGKISLSFISSKAMNTTSYCFIISFFKPIKDSNRAQRIYQGPRATEKKQQLLTWSSGIMPPPLLVSMASNNLTTSSMSGRLSGFPSQHFRMMLANELGQHLGISGRKFCILSSIGSHIRDDKKTNSHKFNLA